jgi:hypothetical protein
MIHQHRNKNIHRHDNLTKKEACTACPFDQHKDFWMNYPRRCNFEYTQIHQEATDDSLKDFDHYPVDTVDLNTMFKDLQADLHPPYRKQFDEYFNTAHDPENLETVNLA